MYTWWLELYPTGVESFPGSHGGMGSLFSTCCRQPQVMGTTCTMEHCLNSALLFFFNVVTSAYLIGQSLYNQSINQSIYTYVRTYVHAHVNGVVQCQPWKSPTIYHRNVRREKNERSVSVHTSVEIAGLLRKIMMMMMNMMTRKL